MAPKTNLRKKSVTDLHHTLPRAFGNLSTDEPPVRLLRRRVHPTKVRRRVVFVCILVPIATSIFWSFVLRDDASRLAFFPSRAVPSSVLFGLAVLGVVTQAFVPMTILRRVWLSSRIPIRRVFALAATWTLMFVGTVVWYVASSHLSPAFLGLSFGLPLSAAPLLGAVLAAARFDGLDAVR